MRLIKRIICLLRDHDWKFSYNYGIPLGTKMPIREVLEKLGSGEAYAVYTCTRCKKQARKAGKRLVVLSSSEYR